MKKIFEKRTNGISLMALIVTIIVLLILVGVSIAMLTGENGIFNKARYAVEKYSNAQEIENELIKHYINEIDEQTSNQKIYAEHVSFTPNDSNWNVKNVKEALDYLYNN